MMFGRKKKTISVEELRAKLAKVSVPYYEIPSIDGRPGLPDRIDPMAYRESAERALQVARGMSK